MHLLVCQQEIDDFILDKMNEGLITSNIFYTKYYYYILVRIC